MKCPFCGHEDTKVTDSRTASDAIAIRRRRQCLACHQRFTTFETVELAIQVQKRDGTYQDFVFEKLEAGLLAACQHTKISREQVKALASGIVNELQQDQCREVRSTWLGERVMERLRSLDSVAYIRFACVYGRFKDLEQVKEVIASISPKDGETICP